jgi:DNA polymerase-3 subunit alpha
MTAKSAVQSTMRGYRSDKYPNGIDNDIAQYATSLIPSERGFTWPLSDVIYGNEEKNRKPITEFVKVIKQYPGLLETILKVEGCVSRRGTHASGVLFLEKGHEYDEGAIMRSPDGSLVTQYDLHSAEACGAVKYDFLLTEVQSIITQAIKILQEHNEIEPELTLRQAYDKYIHPTVLPLDDEQLWDDLAFKDIPHKFQFDSTVGSQTVKTLRPHSAKEMADANSIMRLMAPDTWDETPTERYARMKNDMSQWYKEMDKWGLTKEEQKVLEPHYLPVYASPCQQEQLMLILMDENICGFSLKDANAARKIVAKKQLSKIPDLKAKILETASSENLGKYIWETAVEPQCGYSFSILHSTVYSYIGLQTVYLATHWNKIYWDCACMRIEGGIENDSTTNYDKIAKAVCAASTNINISPIDINKSGYLFEPDVENNTILYGMKALVGINGDMINDIISHRPYSSFEDFCSKVKCTKNTLVPLIKSGAFDQFDERKNIMEKYIWSVCNPKKRITMQNFAGLLDAGLLPDDIDFEKRVFNFTRSLKKFCKQGDKYYLQPKHEAFLQKNFDIDPQVDKDGNIYITVDSWKKVYDEAMKPAKKYISGRKEELLQEYNQYLFNKEWDKYAEGDYSAWEMASLGYYYHEHELAHIDNSRYGITSYKNIPEVPVVEKTFKKGNKVIPIFKTYRIAGTVIAKDDAKSTVTLLTTDSGVVNVKMSREYYARLAKQISKVKPDGTKQVVEKSWFGRGNMLVCNGYRRSGQFACKSYKHSNSHQVYKIIGINGKTIDMTYLRAGEINEE